MKDVNKSWLRKISRLIMSFAVTLFFLGGTSVLNAGIGLSPSGCKGDASTNGYVKDTSVSPDLLYICTNDASYISGNIGGNWFELDLVPFDISVSNDTGTPESIAFSVGGDYEVKGLRGWDYISKLYLDANKSTGDDVGSCPVDESNGTENVTNNNGTIDIKRVVLFDEALPANTTCVYKFNMRLGIGAASYSGSSLHFYILDNPGGKTIAINSDVIQPLGVEKSMVAVKSGTIPWQVHKAIINRGNGNFGNTCDSNNLEKDIEIKVFWRPEEPTIDGNVSVSTYIYAGNGSSRPLTLNFVDILYKGVSGTTEPLNTYTGCEEVTLSAHSDINLTCDFTISVSLADAENGLNNIVVVTYTDTDLGGVNITKSATDAINSPSGAHMYLNDKATIYDTEYIIGADVNFSVEDVNDSALGSFDHGYQLGDTVTQTEDLNWTSNEQNTSGFVIFTKKITAAYGAKLNNGSILVDKAILIGSAQIEEDYLLSIPLSSRPEVSLTINKTRVESLKDENVTFTFNVINDFGYDENVTITLDTGETSGSVTIENDYDLIQAEYTVTELPTPGYEVNGTSIQSIDIRNSCGQVADFHNIPAERPSIIAEKVTYPSGFEASWNMTLLSSADPIFGVTNLDGTVTLLAEGNITEGNYTIEEEQKSGWYFLNKTGDCDDFTYSNSTDANRTDYLCRFENARYGEIIIHKVVDGADKIFEFVIAGNDHNGGNFYEEFNLSNAEEKIFNESSDNLKKGTYTVTETVVTPNPEYDLVSIECTESQIDTPPQTFTTADFVVSERNTEENDVLSMTTINLDYGEKVECTFTNRKRGDINVKKTINGETRNDEWEFWISGNGESYIYPISDGNLTFNDINLVPDVNYTLCEIKLPLTANTANVVFYRDKQPVDTNRTEHITHVDICHTFTVETGETADFEVDNIIIGAISLEIDKKTNDENVTVVFEGDPITWSYTLSNTGEVDLYIESVIDNEEGNVTCPGLVDGWLLAGTTTECTDLGGFAGADDYENNVTVTAHVRDNICERLPPDGGNPCIVSASDTDGYLVEVTAAEEEVIPCDNCESSGSPALGEISAILMVCITLALGLLYIRREEENTLN